MFLTELPTARSKDWHWRSGKDTVHLSGLGGDKLAEGVHNFLFHLL